MKTTRTGWTRVGEQEKKKGTGSRLVGTAMTSLCRLSGCDYCVFVKLYARLPDEGTQGDIHIMSCIRRILLDAFWSRATTTVASNTALIRQGLRHSSGIGLEGPYLPPGPLPGFDHCGYEVALQMVLASLERGTYAAYKQWDTIRKLRSAFSNQVRSSAIANLTTLSLADGKGKYFRLASDPCGSLWFHRFMEGCKRRMGQDWRPNKAISMEIMGALLTAVEQRATGAVDNKSRFQWTMAGAYFCFCYVLSLRGSEGLLVDLEGLIKFDDPGRDFVVVPLLERFKGEHHTTQHLMPCVRETESGIRVEVWIKRLLMIHEAEGRRKGPALVNTSGVQSSSSEMNVMFIDCLTELYEENPSRFGLDIKSAEDVGEKFHVFRSFRRGSESRAVAMNVSKGDRYVVNRWRMTETAGAGRASHTMDLHYVDITLVAPSFLRYT